jgi:hypothetical protein
MVLFVSKLYREFIAFPPEKKMHPENMIADRLQSSARAPPDGGTSGTLGTLGTSGTSSVRAPKLFSTCSARIELRETTAHEKPRG